jgi:hypothetical protein
MFTQTITGDYPEEDTAFIEGLTDSDLIFHPDFSTLAVVPWASDPTAQVIHDAYHKDGTPFEIAPRNVLKSVVQLYTDRGLKPVVAPEMEFYLVKPNLDPDYPLEPPVGRSGRTERARQAYSITAVNEFEELFDDVYQFSEDQGLEIDTLAHEDGTAQMEINLRHGDPVELADQVFLFKAHHPRGGAAPQDVRHIHGQADRQRAGLGHAYPSLSHEPGDRPKHLFRQRQQRADAGVPPIHRRDADLPAQGDVHHGALCKLLPASYPQHERAHQRALGL